MEHAWYPSRGNSIAIGGEVDGQLVGAVLFSDPQQLMYGLEWSVSIALDGAHLTVFPRALKTIFALPFLQRGVVRLTAYVHGKNQKSLNTVERFGFKPEGILRSRFAPGEDCHIFGMLKSECIWIPTIYRTPYPLWLARETLNLKV